MFLVFGAELGGGTWAYIHKQQVRVDDSPPEVAVIAIYA